MRLSKPIYSYTEAREKRRNKVRLALFAVTVVLWVSGGISIMLGALW